MIERISVKNCFKILIILLILSFFVALQTNTVLAAEELPVAVDLSNYFPYAGMQINNDCGAWAVSYMLTYYKAREQNWSPNDSMHFFSPYYLYAREKMYSDYGNNLLHLLNVAVNEGSLPSAVFTTTRLKEIEVNEQPNLFHLEQAGDFKFRSYKEICGITSELACDTDAAITSIKKQLASGNPVLLVIYDTMLRFLGKTATHYVIAPSSTVNSGHVVVIVGYNDNLYYSDVKDSNIKYYGAFKILNSWGQDWGYDGYANISYNAFKQMAVFAYVFENEPSPKTFIIGVKKSNYGIAEPGTSVTYSIVSESVSGFKSPIDIYIESVPKQLEVELSRTTIKPGESANLYIKVKKDAKPSNYSFILTGVSENIVKKIEIKVKVDYSSIILPCDFPLYFEEYDKPLKVETTSRGIFLDWSHIKFDYSHDPEKILIYRKTNLTAKTLELVTVLPLTATSYFDNTLIPNIPAYYYITAQGIGKNFLDRYYITHNLPVTTTNLIYSFKWEPLLGIDKYTYNKIMAIPPKVSDIVQIYRDTLLQNRIVAVWNSGEVYYTDDYGKTWYPYSTVQVGVYENIPGKIIDTAKNRVLVSTSKGSIFTSTTATNIMFIHLTDPLEYKNTELKWAWFLEFLTEIKGAVVNSFTFNPYNTDILYLSTNKGLYISFDAGKTWSNYGLSYVTDVFVTKNNILYATTYGCGVFIKEENGTWRRWENLPTLFTESIAIDEKGAIYLGTNKGLYVSIDNGNTWHLVGFEKDTIKDILPLDEIGKIIITTDLEGFYIGEPYNPLPPAIVKAENADNGIEISWSDSLPGINKISRYDIYKYNDKIWNAVKIASVNSGINEYLDTNITGVENYYYVIAVDESGNKSLMSDIASVSALQSFISNASKINIILRLEKREYYINGKLMYGDAAPYIKNGRTMVPLRLISEAFGATVEWNEKERKVTIKAKDTIIELWINKPIAKVNGKNVYIDPSNTKVVPEIVNGRTMVPVRFVAEMLNLIIKWDDINKVIKIFEPDN